MNTAVFVYIQDSDYFGALSCTAVGTGAGLVWKASDQVLLSVRGGPQIDTPGCKGQQGFSYNASITRQLLHNSQFAVTADRQPTISYLGAGLWQDDVAGGFERRLLLSNAIGFGAGYIHSSTLLNTPSYSGQYFDASYVRQIHGNLSLKGSYRRFTGQSGAIGIDRDVVQVGLSFSPNAHTLFQ
jgi:hypothetical protein